MANYNINAVTRRVVYTGSAGLGPYAFSFEILTQTDVDVYFNDTLLTLTTDYTVTINANGTGSITIVTGTNVPTTPDADDQITIVGARDIERVTDFVTAGEFRASAINEQLDALTIFDQQLSESDDRTVKAPVTDPTSIDMTLPKKADRASKFLLFSATGDVGVASTDTLTVSTLQAFTDYQVDTFTGDNTTVAFTLSAEPGQKGNTQVYFDGVYQAKANYSLVGTSITFTTAPATGVKVEVVHGQAASTYTPDDGSITFAKLATAAVDTDLTSVSASHDTLPSALATKTYVDAQIGSNNELSEVLANGNTSGGTNIVVSAGDSITTNTIAETTAASGVTIDGVLVKDGQVDGRDVSVDGTKLDTVETNADVTDTANVTAAGALMDSELTNITAVKALDQGVATTDTPTFAGVITAGNVDGRDVSVDGAKLDGIEANADVTDTANVTAAGALMDSELTNITAVKALDQGVTTTDSPSFAGLTATTADINGGTIDGATIGGASAAAGTFTTLSATGNTTLGDAAADVTQNKGGFAAQGTGLPGSGSGVEINFGLVAGEGTVQAFDRSGSAWEQLRLRGNQVAFDISGSEKMRLTSTGLGVGTSSASYPLEVYRNAATTHVRSAVVNPHADAYNATHIYQTTNRQWEVGAFDTAVGLTSTWGVRDDTAAAYRFLINSSGNVGIGTTPSRKLEVLKSGVDDVNIAVIGGGSGAGGASVAIGASGTSSYIRGVNNGVGAYVPLNLGGSYTAFETGAAEKMRIDSSGNVGIGRTPSYKLDVSHSGATASQAMRVADSTPTEYYGIFNANTGGNTPNAANATVKVRGMATTNRSINAGGTVNASGADYAEYMHKADGCGTIAKGDVCGVDADGKLTDQFDNAHSFVVKSTDPSYVGGDVWSKTGQTDDEGREVLLEGDALEAARQNVDRIAFAGQVPCNVTGPVAVGYYVVPQRSADGGIEAVCVDSPTLDQYISAVGRVWKMGDASTHLVAVKIG